MNNQKTVTHYNTDNRYEYRKEIYDTYVTQTERPEALGYIQEDYLSWSESAKIRLKNWLPDDLETPILDLGCGSGNFLYLLQELGYSNLTGVDFSQEQLSFAQKWCPNAKLIHDDAHNVLANNPNSFGLVTGFDIIEHLGKEEQIPFLNLVFQSLRPGGRLILQTPNAESPWMGSIGYSDFTHEWFYTPRGLTEMLRRSGLIDCEARATGPYIHGIKSFFRVILWRMISASLKLWNVAETGGKGSGIYTRIFIISASKPKTILML